MSKWLDASAFLTHGIGKKFEAPASKAAEPKVFKTFLLPLFLTTLVDFCFFLIMFSPKVVYLMI